MAKFLENNRNLIQRHAFDVILLNYISGPSNPQPERGVL